MCAAFERLEREIQNGLDLLEMDEEGNADPEKTVKAYRRSAAGNEQPLPSDVRPPERTLDYLVDSVLSHYPLQKCHAFIRDRTRSIRQDFTLQNIRDVTAVKVHERIARFHILCLHEMSDCEEEKFSEQQETEQLRKVLLSLIEFYDDLREEGIETENEAEFRAYHIITHMRDQDVARQAMALPPHLFMHPYIQQALAFYGLAQRNNEIEETSSRRNKPVNVEACQNFYSKFFKLVADSSTSFLMACLLEGHFPDVRKGALKAMNHAYLYQTSGVDAEYLRQTLAYDTTKQLLQEATLYGLVLDMSAGQAMIKFGQKHFKTKARVFREPYSNPKARKSMLLVEPKKAGRSYRDIVNGESAGILPSATTVYAQQPLIEKTVIQPPSSIIKGQATAFASAFPPSSHMGIAGSMPLHKSAAELAAEEEQARLEEQRRLAEEKMAAEAAAQAAAAEERRILQLQQQRQMEAARLREQQIQEEKARLAAQIAYQKQKQRESAEAAARAEQERRQALEKKLRRHALISKLANKWTRELMEEVLREQSEVITMQTLRRMRSLKRKMMPHIERARNQIQKRHSQALKRSSIFNFMSKLAQRTGAVAIPSTNALIHGKSIHMKESTEEKVGKSLRAERRTLINNMNNGNLSPATSLWVREDFSSCIYPNIQASMAKLAPHREDNSAKPTWQLCIAVEDKNQESAIWFKHKFGLDDEFSRCIKHFDDMNIVTRSISSQDCIYGKAVDETGAIVFSLSDLRHSQLDDSVNFKYWAKEKERLDRLAQKLRSYSSAFQVPFLITYWQHTETLQHTMTQIPALLGLDTNPVISDYQLLVMNPNTIHERLPEELTWLATHTIFNHPLRSFAI
ncbi:SAC3/GANP/Nin1/mts3/eIF-3 p25 family-domain-containing protein [Radiomyces spectabilis]|uniref:SAC3/GANP/Nin1/mts3/eIF-3 p25 family-domain-containing protein n=1 Tax=Radiomyces spectabilis TaxID=64574 RepID=UPI00221E808D|nr:SAC3/GANP/Nin1/mts3/eIF-3 p25 family-domain-containing protein [Radiomyces spectabilis]KAI8388507.1 SAC3/GANP/Nin1/mts3/eIF-3 p25 family-domain-containing protein [Radiomyces spectabilis]